MAIQSKAFLSAYREYLASNSGKFTHQREIIIEEFLRSKSHIGADALFSLVQKRDSKIGLASVYRTLNSLVDSGLAVERRFVDRSSVYEPNDADSHHDHMICMRCRTIVEFEDDEIERLQLAVAKRLGFTLVDHKLELFGLCNNGKCRAVAKD